MNTPQSYSLDFASTNGVPSSLSHTLTPADLATVTDGYAAPVAGQSASAIVIPFHPWSTLEYALFPAEFGFPVPWQRTDYLAGSPTTIWEQDAYDSGQEIFGPYRTFRPGENLSQIWGVTPSVPAPEWEDRGLPREPQT